MPKFDTKSNICRPFLSWNSRQIKYLEGTNGGE